ERSPSKAIDPPPSHRLSMGLDNLGPMRNVPIVYRWKRQSSRQRLTLGRNFVRRLWSNAPAPPASVLAPTPLTPHRSDRRAGVSSRDDRTRPRPGRYGARRRARPGPPRDGDRDGHSRGIAGGVALALARGDVAGRDVHPSR